ncbi:hypothetical protein [Streptosporangium sp. NPDC051022]|uniref:hypothetical protein n=1 Tax=Streptosporangium sp. NPDC051022 TaxID=3155752 RepID=UPI0034337BA9
MTVRLAPVLEIRRIDGFRAWPVAEARDRTGVALSGRLTPGEIGAVLASLADGAAHGFLSRSRGDRVAAAAIGAVLERESLMLPGGIEVSDPGTGRTVVPGESCDLEFWRDWSKALTGEEVWMGFAPSPWLERRGERLRVWCDGGCGENVAADDFVEFPAALFPALLHAVHEDLRGFLRAAGEWADAVEPSLARALVLRLDRALRVSGPLEIG